MISKQLQPFSHDNSLESFGFLSPSITSDDFDRLRPVQQPQNPQYLQEILQKVQQLKQQFEYKQANDVRYIKLIPVVNVDSHAKVTNPLQKYHQKSESNKPKQKIKLNPLNSNPISNPKSKKQRLLNFLVKTGTPNQSSKIVQNMIKDQRQQQHIKSRILSQRKRKASNQKTLPPIQKAEDQTISKIANRSHSYNMIKINHLEHKFNKGGVNNFLKKGSGVTGAIINSLATQDQKRKINYNKNLFYHKHNHALPEDAVVMWDQRLMHMLSIMKGAKENKLDKLNWNRRRQENERLQTKGQKIDGFEFEEFNIDEAFMNGDF